MPGDILYQSGTTTFPAAAQYIISSFDGDANTFAPFIARAITSGIDSTGGSITMPDINYPPTVEFVNGSLAVGTVDIYDDAGLTSQIVSDHSYMEVSAELEIELGDNPVLYTPTTLTSPVLIDGVVSFAAGLRGRAIAYGPSDALEVRRYVPDRRSVESEAKLHLYNASTSYEAINIYIVDAGTTIEGKVATRPVVPSGIAIPVIGLPAGSFDIYITEFFETDIIAGPISIDVALGDALGGVIFDIDNSALLQLNFLPNNP
jgi:hypothetical protein